MWRLLCVIAFVVSVALLGGIIWLLENGSDQSLRLLVAGLEYVGSAVIALAVLASAALMISVDRDIRRVHRYLNSVGRR